MLIWENIKIACKALFSNKLRALLTMLGIIIGIGSVIAIMTVSESAGTATIDKNGDTASVSVSGVNKEYFQSDKVTLLAGRFIKKTDLDGSKHVIMVSDKKDHEIR